MILLKGFPSSAKVTTLGYFILPEPNSELLSSYWLCLTGCLVAENNTSYTLFPNVISNNGVKTRTGMKFNGVSSLKNR